MASEPQHEQPTPSDGVPLTQAELHLLRKQRRSPHLRVLRALIYLAPAFVAITLAATAPVFPYSFWIIPLILLTATLCLGAFDSLFTTEVRKHNGHTDPKGIIAHAFRFLALQVVIAPCMVVVGFLLYILIPI